MRTCYYEIRPGAFRVLGVMLPADGLAGQLVHGLPTFTDRRPSHTRDSNTHPDRTHRLRLDLPRDLGAAVTLMAAAAAGGVNPAHWSNLTAERSPVQRGLGALACWLAADLGLPTDAFPEYDGEATFITAIRECFVDGTTWGALADWLQEAGSPRGVTIAQWMAPETFPAVKHPVAGYLNDPDPGPDDFTVDRILRRVVPSVRQALTMYGERVGYTAAAAMALNVPPFAPPRS